MEVVFLLLLLHAVQVQGLGEVMFAVNCGGDSHTDVNGIRYAKDTATVGTASDFGKNSQIRRIAESDQILYQTERYHTDDFTYKVPLNSNGEYVLILKFSEVYFTSKDEKVFDVRLNDQHAVVSDLDIFDRVGRGVAHDEYIPFTIEEGILTVNEKSSPLSRDGKLSINFVKGQRDNPKINAIAILRGGLDDVPKLPEWPNFDGVGQGQDEVKHTPEASQSKFKKTSGPKSTSPYDKDESWLLPIFIAIGVFVPTVICLCRLA